MEFLLQKAGLSDEVIRTGTQWDYDRKQWRPANMGETVRQCLNLIMRQEGLRNVERRDIQLVVSSPFFLSQALQAANNLPRDWSVEPIGYELPQALKGKPLTILDELAKSFALELKRRELIEKGFGAEIILPPHFRDDKESDSPTTLPFTPQN